MNRRNFIQGSASAGLLAAAAVGWMPATAAEPQNLPVIGLLDGLWSKRLLAEVVRGLKDNGLVEGKHFKARRSGWRGAEFQVDQLARHAAGLVSQRVALILACSNKAALAARTVTSTTPIIFLADDPGLVDDPQQPGGNLTGAVRVISGLITKRIEIVRELVPTANLIVLATDPTNTPAHDLEMHEARAASQALGLELAIIAWTGEGGIEPEFTELPRGRKAVLVFGDGLPFFVRHPYLDYIAKRYEMPAIHGNRDAVDEGGLVSFGTRFADAGYLMGVYAARVLKGDRPAGLPVRPITGTELVINRWTARSQGIAIPSMLLRRADEVIDD